MILLLAGLALGAPLAVDARRVALIEEGQVLVLSLDDGSLLQRLPTGGFAVENVLFSGDLVVALSPDITLAWRADRLQVLSQVGVDGPAASIGDGLMVAVSPFGPAWVDLEDLDRLPVAGATLRLSSAALAGCVALPDREAVACGAAPGPDCAGALRGWAGGQEPLPLCSIADADPSGLLGRTADGAWAWLDATGGLRVLPELPKDARVAVGPTAWVAESHGQIQVMARDGGPGRSFPVPEAAAQPPPEGLLLLGGALAAIAVNPETGALGAAYPSALGRWQKDPPYADLDARPSSRFTRASGRDPWTGPDGWSVAPGPDGVTASRRGKVQAELVGVWEPLDAHGANLLLVQRQPRTQVTLLRHGQVRWRYEMPNRQFDDGRLIDGDAFILLPGAVARLDGRTGEVRWAVHPPVRLTAFLTEGSATPP